MEATFDMDKHKLKTIFHQLDLDEERHTLIRRELSATGKSRAFINDTPVTLDALRTVGNALVDIHTQRQPYNLPIQRFTLILSMPMEIMRSRLLHIKRHLSIGIFLLQSSKV